MIVRWGLKELPHVLRESGIGRPLLVASPRWDGLLEASDRWSEIPSHRIAVPTGVDGILALGGGSAIDTAKAASASSSLPLVSVPTTYSGSEWTAFFGVRSPDRRQVGGGSGARRQSSPLLSAASSPRRTGRVCDPRREELRMPRHHHDHLARAA